MNRRMIRSRLLVLVAGWLAGIASGAPGGGAAQAAAANGGRPGPLFPADGVPAGWTARNWSDVSQPAAPTTRWLVRDGTLLGSEPRGTWLVSERQYGDFVLEFEFRLPPRGNGGVGFRFPAAGDPAVEGFELQLVDPRYYPSNAAPAAVELTGSLYQAAAPAKQAFKPDEWNRCRIRAVGARIEVSLNGQTVQDLKLEGALPMPPRGKALGERPRRGHLGFQELSRAGGQIQIRNPRITELEGAEQDR